MSILKANRIENLTTTDGGININNSGNIGVGNTSPTSLGSNITTIHAKGSSGAGIAFGSSSSNQSLALFTSGDGTVGRLRTLTNMPLAIGTNGTERMRILADGGLTFNGDTATANALDDYEEGTWTPHLYVGSTQQTLDVSYGIYRKIGSLVFIKCHVSPSSVSGSGAVQIRNLPFTQASGGLNQTAVAIQWSGTLGEYGIYANIWRTNDVVQFARSNAGGNTGSLEGTDIAANSNFGIAGCYEV